MSGRVVLSFALTATLPILLVFAFGPSIGLAATTAQALGLFVATLRACGRV